ncbi:MAG: FG-GAP-like repeat-containing protein [Acidobacteriota bacterium]|nr:FG-GAP-like repeat-containing protein [Acidobacteriota bacterium]
MKQSVTVTPLIKIAVIAGFLVFSLVFSSKFLPSEIVLGKIGAATSLNAPTAVRATDNQYYNKVGVYWDTVRGANVYRIFRGIDNNPAAAIEIGSTAANYFFDTSAAVNQTYFYRVKAGDGSTVSDFSQPDQGTRAVGALVPGAFSPLDPPPTPDGNQISATKAYLGKTLFWDEQISSTRTVACGTCHRSSEGGSDPRTAVNNAATTNAGFDHTLNTADDVYGSPGVPANNQNGTYNFLIGSGFNAQVTPRKAPSYLNAGYSPNGLFWDGRALDTFRDPLTNAVVLASQAGLESQILFPPLNGGEMAHGGRNWTQVAARVAESKPLALAANVPTALKTWIDGRTYPQLFEEAFGTPDVTPARIAQAIATHERTLFSDQAPLDKWASGIESLQPQEESGRQLFVNLQCNTCHNDALLTDHTFRNIGVRPASEDLGRGAVTGNSQDDGAFKTPTLRNVELHAPYMHNGRFATLEEVVEFYNRGGDFDAPNIDHGVIRPLFLSDEQKADLVAFMKRPLTDSRVANELPPFDHPTLYTETDRVPTITGTGRAGAGGIVPQATAIEPPLVGNPSFTVAVSRGFGGAQAVLVIDSVDPGIGASIPASGSLTRQTVNLSGSGNGSGAASISLPLPNNPALIGQTFFGRWYVSDAAAPNGFSVSQAFRFTVFGEAAVNARATRFDFDGDGKSDVSVFRPATGAWYLLQSTAGFTGAQFGQNGDVIVPADYDGDGKTDLAVWRQGVWYLQRSTAGFTGIQFGSIGDIPAPADFDGDGKADLAVFRPSTGAWYLLQSTAGFAGVNFGQNGDRPAAADYDGDGKADIAVYRAGAWYIQRSQLGFTGVQFGQTSDIIAPADYDGDGKTDVAVFRPSEGAWYLLRSTAGFTGAQFGANGDLPAPADYDGDGKADLGVFRNGVWYLQRSTAGFTGIQFGSSGDLPAPNAYAR